MFHALGAPLMYAFLLRVRDFFYGRPLLDELWYRANRYWPGHHLRIKEIHGSRMELDLRDSGVSRDLFLWRTREPECTRIFKGELREGMVVVDIGANVGYYVLIEARILGSAGTIHVIEPSPGTYDRLVQNLALNSIAPELKLYQFAICDCPGTVTLQLGSASNHHRLAPPNNLNDGCVEVEATTLDDLFADARIDMVRMDTEGSEVRIVRGMKKILARNQPFKMFIEIHPRLARQYGCDIEEMLALLAEAGFRVNHYVDWVAGSHLSIPYLLGNAPRERSIALGRPLSDLLIDPDTREMLLCWSGHAYEAGYKLFLER